MNEFEFDAETNREEIKRTDENPPTDDEAKLLDEMGLFGESRRRFPGQLSKAGLSVPAVSLLGKHSISAMSEADLPAQISTEIDAVAVSLKINGAQKSLSLHSRVTEATACGEVIKLKASHSQEMGGAIWGIVMALQEATEIDHRYERIMNPNLAGYPFPCNAHIHTIENDFVPEEDKIVNELGVKGMGEVGIVGIPAAIANAVSHATGKRLREPPITPDKLL
jgi:xanthine dehydrogenase YagR molybdenum-binding subunit